MTSNLPQLLGAVLLSLVIGAVVALTWHGSISGGEAMGAISVIVAGALGALSVHAGVTAGASAAAGTTVTNVTAAPPADPAAK